MNNFLTQMPIYLAALAPAVHFALHGYAFALKTASGLDGIPAWLASFLGLIAGAASAFILELAGVKMGTLIFEQYRHGAVRWLSVVLFGSYAAVAILTMLEMVEASVATIVIAIVFYLGHGIDSTMIVRVVAGSTSPVTRIRQVYGGRIKALIRKARRLSKQAATLTAENESLSSSNDALTIENKALLSDVDTLTNHVSERDAEIGRLTKLVNTRQQEVDRVTKLLETESNRVKWIAKAPPVLIGVAKDFAKHGKLNGTADKYGISTTDIGHINRIAKKEAVK